MLKKVQKRKVKKGDHLQTDGSSSGKGLIKSPFNLDKNMKVSLNLGERVAALKIFDAFKGNISTLAVLIDDVKLFTVSEEEWKTAGLVKTQSADGTQESWKWNEVVEKEIEIQKESLAYLLAKIKEKSDANEITLADLALMSLEKKLK